MLFCPAERCAVCFLPRGSASCLRKQAHRCLLLARSVSRRPVRDALEDLGSELMKEAIAVEHANELRG
jgi:hypothetical protein